MRRVYIMDDSQEVYERLPTMVAEAAGADLAGVSGDPGEAVAAICRLHPDAAILDIRKPGINGIKALHGIIEDHCPMVVLMFTNCPLEAYRRKCAEAGADYFFHKSTDFGKINWVLDNVVHKDR